MGFLFLFFGLSDWQSNFLKVNVVEIQRKLTVSSLYFETNLKKICKDSIKN